MENNRWLEFDGKRYSLAKGQTALGFFLPCMTDAPDRVVAKLPDLSKWVTRAAVFEKTELTNGLYKILLETERQTEWRAGQYISIRNADGDVRSYSIASLPEDYYLELHVKHYPNGKISDWLVNTVSVGETIEFNGPVGTCFYSKDIADQAIILISTGCGAGAMLGIARQALRQNHQKSIKFYHGSTFESGLYLRKELRALATEYSNFSAYCVASGQDKKKQITDVMLSQNPDLSGSAVFICGNPDMVETARVGALRNGAGLEYIFSDPFVSFDNYKPQDTQKVLAFAPAPDMWVALENGKLLTEILTEFYNRAFKDVLLAPFFHKVTKQRLIEKQYAFTRDLLTGTQDYFGELPFNSHHWMIISDELFDHRERLFFKVVSQFDLSEKLVNEWAALNEIFRREIVKSTSRGQMIDGKEHFHKTSVIEEIFVDSVCDGCHQEILTGEFALVHARTGELFCQTCNK